MSQYTFLLVWLAAMYLISHQTNVLQKERVCGITAYRATFFFAVLVFIPIIWMAAHRGNFADTMMYNKVFRELPTSFSGLLAYMPTVKKDQGFTFLSGLLKIIFGNSNILYLAIIASIQGICLISVFRKYSGNYLMSIFLFVASTDYISWMFNGIRQFTAVTLIFAATTLILYKKWFSAVLVILLASTMHQSALLMIPVIFIVQGKAWNFKTVFFLSIALIAVMFADQFTTILDDMMQETQYSNMVTDWEEWGDDGTSFLRVAVYSIPTVLSLIGLKYIRHANDPVINLCVNMSIVSTGLYIISMFTSGIFMGRLPIYASLYNYILLPWELQNIFAKNSRKLLTLGMVCAYLFFYIYQIKFAWGL